MVATPRLLTLPSGHIPHLKSIEQDACILFRLPTPPLANTDEIAIISNVSRRYDTVFQARRRLTLLRMRNNISRICVGNSTPSGARRRRFHIRVTGKRRSNGRCEASRSLLGDALCLLDILGGSNRTADGGLGRFRLVQDRRSELIKAEQLERPLAVVVEDAKVVTFVKVVLNKREVRAISAPGQIEGNVVGDETCRSPWFPTSSVIPDP